MMSEFNERNGLNEEAVISAAGHNQSAKLKELVEYMAKSLVENPDQVAVAVKESNDAIELSLAVAPDDMGKVIGKQGRIAKAMRSVLRAASSREGKKCILEID